MANRITSVFKRKFEKPILTREDLTEKLKRIFRKHIGREDSITKLQLYNAIFGDPSYYDPYELWYNWNRIRQGMNWLRRTTKFFIVSMKDTEHNSIWRYCVVKDDIDGEPYKELLANNRKRMSYMIGRCNKAIDEKFWLSIQKGEE